MRANFVRLAAFGVSLCSMAAVLAGCSNSDQWTGQVTTLGPAFCVGRHAATGECFKAKPSLIAKLYVGECVMVTYASNSGTVAPTLSAVKEVPASSDRTDCPDQSG